MARVGLVGLGRMGLSMAGALQRAGHLVLTYDISPHARDAAERAGVELAASIAEVGNRSEVVLLSLPDTDSVYSVVAGQDGLIPSMAAGGAIIDTSTVSPSVADAMSVEAAGSDLAYLDAPVSGSVPWAESGRLTIMVGGEETSYNEHLPLLECIGEHIFYVGESGSGQRIKLCHQLIFYATSTAIFEAAAVAERLGIERQTLLEVVSKCAAPAHVLHIMSSSLIERNYENALGDINLGVKDLELVTALVQQAGLPSILDTTPKDLYRTASEHGYGDLSLLELSEETLLSKLIDDPGRIESRRDK